MIPRSFDWSVLVKLAVKSEQGLNSIAQFRIANPTGSSLENDHRTCLVGFEDHMKLCM